MTAATWSIRNGGPSDLPFLREMLYEAAYWRPSGERPSLEAGLSRPDLVYLLEGWGRSRDTAVVAVDEEGRRLGAAWYRLWDAGLHSYGYIDPETPELAIGVRSDQRGQGIGAALLQALLSAGRAAGLKSLSLSVEIENPARRLYQKIGFQIYEADEYAWTMRIEL